MGKYNSFWKIISLWYILWRVGTYICQRNSIGIVCDIGISIQVSFNNIEANHLLPAHRPLKIITTMTQYHPWSRLDRMASIVHTIRRIFYHPVYSIIIWSNIHTRKLIGNINECVWLVGIKHTGSQYNNLISNLSLYPIRICIDGILYRLKMYSRYSPGRINENVMVITTT